MRLLLDTHALLWSAHSPERLSPSARSHIEDGNNQVFFSVASIWEIAVKLSIEKLRLSISPEQLVSRLNETGFIEMPIESRHTAKVAAMPFHHRDPFDRLLVAQAEVEQIALISRDLALDAYGVRRLW